MLLLVGDLKLKGIVSSPPPESTTSQLLDNTSISDISGCGCLITITDISVWRIGDKIVRWKTNMIWQSSKIQNRNVKMYNGNRSQGSNLDILHWNGGSRKWQNKRLEIECLLREKDPDLCYISEANLWTGLDSMDMDIPGYKLILPNTMTSLLHARLVLLVRNDVTAQLLVDNNDKEAAAIWVKVGSTRRKSLVVGGIYRQHQLLGQETELTRQQLLQQQERRWTRIVDRWRRLARNSDCVVVGDLNLDYLRWDSPESHLEGMVDELKNSIETAGFQQLVVNYTRTWRQQSDSLLDHVWTNCPVRTLKVWNVDRASSDHNIIGIKVALKDSKINVNNVVKRTWKDFKRNECIQEFKDTDWTDVLSEFDVNVANAILEEKICSIMNKFAPMRTIQIRKDYKCWLSDVTKVKMLERDAARNLARQSDLDNHWDRYRSLRNECTRLQSCDRKKSLRDTYEKIESEDDSARLFAVTRQLLGWEQSGPPSCLNENGKILRKQKEIADCQASYYADKISKIKSKLPQVTIDPLGILKKSFKKWRPAGGMPTFILRSVTEREVGDMIASLKNSHAYGIDLIDSMTIKMAASTLVPVITHVINLSLCTATFPARWKLSRILPLLKSKDSDPTNPASYRPISQLPVLSKLTERTVQCQLMTYLENNNLLSAHHHAYREKHNTSTALIQIMDALATATDINCITATMNVDLTAAFDCVPTGS